MKAAWSRWTGWWQAQPRRQQLLVIGALFVLGAGSVDALVWSPAEKARRPLRQQIATLNEQASQQRVDLQARAAEQQRLRTVEAALRQRLAAAEATIEGARERISGPEALRRRIRDLSADGSVQLVSLSTLPAEPLDPAARGPAVDARLYRMPVSVTVEGPYAALRDHLAKLEAAEAGLVWHSLSLDNAAWPKVRMELKLMLPSDRAQWRGP